MVHPWYHPGDEKRQDLQSYSRALDACGGARRWEEALGLVQEGRGALG